VVFNHWETNGFIGNLPMLAIQKQEEGKELE
jgi:hypothetical protein